MFTTNPWTLYASVIGPLLAGYYLFVGIRFYREDIREKITRWRSPSKRIASLPEQKHKPTPANPIETYTDYDQDENEPVWENEQMMRQLEGLSVHLKESIEQAHQRDYNKQELILLLQMTLKEYPALAGTPFQLSINNLVDAECAKYGSIHLRGEDKMVIWSQVE